MRSLLPAALLSLFLAACGAPVVIDSSPDSGLVARPAPRPSPPVFQIEQQFDPAIFSLADAGPGTPYPIPDWVRATPEEHAVDAAALETAATVASANGSYCLLVIRHGRLVFERYFDGATAWQTHSSWSIAKSYSSVLVGIAIDRGEIQGLAQSASDFVPSWKGTPREGITIGHLLSMTSGLKWSAFDDYVTMATLATNHTQHALQQPLADPPGTKWTYNNEAVQIFDAVFRSATGKTIEEYAQLHLWSKLGMNASWRHDPSGNPTPYANALATCRDHARFGYLLLHQGKWNGAQVVSKKYLDGALSPSQSLNRAYGNLFWLNAGTPAIDAMMMPWPGRMVPFAPPDLFAARGFGNQFIDVIPSLDLIVVRFGTDPMAVFKLADLAADARFSKHDEILKPILAGVH
jgi:CubicO group peptidase (beta-lactamase class C family)